MTGATSEGALSSKPIEHELNKIRDNFTPSLGKDHGRALLKIKKPLFEQRLAELRTKLPARQLVRGNYCALADEIAQILSIRPGNAGFGRGCAS